MSRDLDNTRPHMAVSIIAYDQSHFEALVNLSLRAWAPVFPLLKADVPGYVYEAFYPEGWEPRQRADISEILATEAENVDVAMLGTSPVGWICTKIHPEDSMAEIHVLAVDPQQQGLGVAQKLMERSYERAHKAGMRMIMVETGDDAGHTPARGLYEAAGFDRWPVARYFKDLRE